MFALFGQPLRQLAGGCRLAGTLKTEQQNDARPFGACLQSAFGVAEQRDHFVSNDLDDLLRRRQAAEHVLPQRPIAHPVDERLDDFEIDVGFEQRQTNLPQRRFDVLRRQPRLAPQGLENVLETIAQRVEHQRVPVPRKVLVLAQTLIVVDVAGICQS